jgi:hypothetical protein
MEIKRFYYCHSSTYGWCVYDREQHHTPAYWACNTMLPPVKVDESGTVCESPVLLKNEYAAMSLCRRLNVAQRRAMKEG